MRQELEIQKFFCQNFQLFFYFLFCLNFKRLKNITKLFSNKLPESAQKIRSKIRLTFKIKNTENWNYFC